MSSADGNRTPPRLCRLVCCVARCVAAGAEACLVGGGSSGDQNADPRAVAANTKRKCRRILPHNKTTTMAFATIHLRFVTSKPIRPRRSCSLPTRFWACDGWVADRADRSVRWAER